jgi:hypothetical protein
VRWQDTILRLPCILVWAGIGLLPLPCGAGELPLPSRSPAAQGGRALAVALAVLEPEAREERIFAEVMRGNIPDFLRTFVLLRMTGTVGGAVHIVEFRVLPEYLALGADEDYLLMPMTPGVAQRIADTLGCTFPTRKMADTIYARASVKLAPIPLPWTPASTGVPEFARHNDSVRISRSADPHPAGALVAGHKKDIIVSGKIAFPDPPPHPRAPVVIYGWHRPGGVPIQPLFAGHADSYADYSHGVRLVKSDLLLDGKPGTVAAILADTALAALLSDEGPIPIPRYPVRMHGVAGEIVRTLRVSEDAIVTVNMPAGSDGRKTLPVMLVLYALPNGNSTAQSAGKRMAPGDDWHYDIQHIAAQTRFLRAALPERRIIVAYVEAAGRSWPAWRRARADGNARIAAIVDSLRQFAGGHPAEIVLSGHSGGGSFLFGYVDAVGEIPDGVTRLAFLDATYGYSDSSHGGKIARWLGARDDHALCVLAYDDSAALLDGRPFVTPQGGTWYTSHRMIDRLGESFLLSESVAGPLHRITGLEGRIHFSLMENPGRTVLHTEQVEKNGFIHAILAGRREEERGYTYFGRRAYERAIAREAMGSAGPAGE